MIDEEKSVCFTHPKVLINPLTLPSAYKDTISPICKKADGDSFMVLHKFSSQNHQVGLLFFCSTGPWPVNLDPRTRSARGAVHFSPV